MHEAIKNPKIIALDYDGTLALNSYPQAGDPNWPVINKALAEQAAGAKLILWTCREGDELAIALDACASWGLHIAAVNDNLPEMQRFFGNNPRKIFGNEYWDDRAVNPTVDAVVLPCKVGDKIYKLWSCGKNGKAVAEFEITHIDIDYLPEIEFAFRKPKGTGYYYFAKVGEIGKTVFLTREEAEAALAKMDGERRTDGNL